MNERPDARILRLVHQWLHVGPPRINLEGILRDSPIDSFVRSQRYCMIWQEGTTWLLRR